MFSLRKLINVITDDTVSGTADNNNEGSTREDMAGTSVLNLPEMEANRRLKLYHRAHRWDPNLGDDDLEEVAGAFALQNPETEAQLVNKVIENSPYPEVRAAVRNYDEDVPASTVRAWFLGMLLTTLGSGLNALFSLRAPSISITSIVALLVAHPLGSVWAKVMPSRKFKTFGQEWSLNPGPFNIKEHTLIVIMANASFGGGAAYFTDTIQAQNVFYHQDFGMAHDFYPAVAFSPAISWAWNILLALSTQVVGFGIAGLARRWLVEPASMIWPQNLVSTSFIYTLHDDSDTDPETTNGWTISRYRYYIYVFVGSFIWYWLPGLIAPCLSVFAFATWIKPNNVIVNQIFGGWTGLSLLPITFDWSQITGYIGSPLIPPFHAIANTLIGTIIFYMICAAGLHYSNHWYAQYLPLSDSGTYDNNANTYNVSKILTPEHTLDVAKYEAYSPIFLSTTFALSYGLSFATIAALIVHTAIFHGQEILIMAKATRGELDDIHMKMMKKYTGVPWWWYMILLLTMLIFCFTSALAWPTHLTWWALVLALIIPLVWTIPIGMVQGTTNIQLGLNVFTEFIIGYMLPGRPLAMMLFKTYGYITMAQALSFTQDLKLGHYMKVPPRSMFWGQLVATVWSCLVQLTVVIWSLENISDICHPHQPSRFICPGGRVFFNASVLWGLIGPARIFSGSSTYADLQYFWLAGALAPILIYIAARIWPRSKARFLNAPILFGGMGMIPPATPLNYLSWSIVGFIFQKYIRNRFRGWWMRFNYITSAALDTGLAICTIVVIAAINLSRSEFSSWWGNQGALNTMDNLGTAIRQQVPEGETFGPASW